MIDKKMMLIVGAGIAAVSIAMTVNIFVNKPGNSNTNKSDHLTCRQLQAAIDRQTAAGRIRIEQLPALLRSNLDWIAATDPDCRIKGDNWVLDKGIIKIQPTDQVPTNGFTDPITMPLK